MLRRMIIAGGERLAASDVDDLEAMLDLENALAFAIQRSVTGLRIAGHTWADIGARCGFSRQAAQQRWGLARAARLVDTSDLGNDSRS